MKSIPLLRQCVAQGVLRPIDRYLAEQLLSLSTDDSEALALAIALTSRAAGDGHVCLDLEDWAGQPLLFQADTGLPIYYAPELHAWRAQLQASDIVAAAEHMDAIKPLVMDGAQRLYLARYYAYERRIAEQVGQRLSSLPVANLTEIHTGLLHYFAASTIHPDLQKTAAALAMLQPFTVISGGPGTGKTTTVTRILALYLQLMDGARIALVAPTGKAAARLTESIRGAKQTLSDIEAEVLQQIPEQASTVHRLLKPLRNSSQFQHHRDNPLHLDLLIVDEASMLDVPLMAKLLDALPPHCRIILLGDRDQLASVEAGSVFSDLCNRGAPVHYSAEILKSLHDMEVETSDMDCTLYKGMANSVAVLSHSHRFGADSGIGQLARCINAAEVETALQVCNEHDDTQLQEVSPEQLSTLLPRRAVAGFRNYLQAKDAEAALAAYGEYRILCALREGDYGVTELNRNIEQALHQAGLIDTGERYYHGRPVMIRSNDYHLQLYNGDIGICLRDPQAENRVRVFFQNAEGQLRAILPSRLPEHETAYAMTVHKSQGSEFERCLLVLPQRDAAILTRELIYTGITRAKGEIEIWCGDLGVFTAAISRRVERHSGLYESLWS